MLGAAGCGSSDRLATASHTPPVVTLRRGETSRSHGETAFRRFGDAASDPQLLAIGHALRIYYNALAGNQYAQACAMLAKSTRRQLVRSARSRRVTTCIGFVSATLARAREVGPTAAQFTILKVIGARVAGSRGYVLFKTAPEPREDDVMDVSLEEGRWRIDLFEAPSIAFSHLALG